MKSEMVNIFTAYKLLMQTTMNWAAGLKPQKVEIGDEKTVMNVWAPTKKSDKPAVVFLQGFTADGMLTWQIQALSFSKEYSVYVPDFIFFGESTTKSSRRTVGFQAECVVESLTKLGARFPVTVVGFSYGGVVGFEMARSFPEVVGSLVVTCAVVNLTESLAAECLAGIGDGMFQTWSEFLLPETLQGVKKLIEFATYRREPLRWIPDWMFKHYLQVMFGNRKERAELIEAMVIPDSDTVPRFSQMVHILSGENDKIFVSGIEKAIKEKLGDRGTLQFIGKAGHLVLFERPFVYNQMLKKILTSAVASSSSFSSSI